MASRLFCWLVTIVQHSARESIVKRQHQHHICQFIRLTLSWRACNANDKRCIVAQTHSLPLFCVRFKELLHICKDSWFVIYSSAGLPCISLAKSAFDYPYRFGHSFSRLLTRPNTEFSSTKSACCFFLLFSLLLLIFHAQVATVHDYSWNKLRENVPGVPHIILIVVIAARERVSRLSWTCFYSMLLKLDSILHRQQHINKTDSSVMRCFHTGSTKRTSTFIFIYVYAVDSFFGVHMSMCISSQIYVCIDNNFVADDWNGRVGCTPAYTLYAIHMYGNKAEWEDTNKKKKKLKYKRHKYNRLLKKRNT